MGSSYNIHIGYAVASIFLLLLQYFLNSRTSCSSPYRQYLNPSQIMLAYVLCSYLGGAVFLSLGISYFPSYLTIPKTWTWLNFWVWFCTMFLALITTHNSRSWFVLGFFENKDLFFRAIIAASVAILISQKFIFGLLMWIGILFYLTVSRIGVTKLFIFLFLSLLALVFAFYGSKRFIIFPMIIAFLFMSANKPPAKLVFFGFLLIVISLILFMSVLRGYGGGVGVQGLTAYLGNELVWEMIGNNFEIVYFYFHGVNATEMMLANFEVLLGETFAKGFLFGWNYLGVDHGLRSSIDVYTNLFSKDTREVGGSFPVNLYAEFYMNFSFLVFFLLPAFLWWVDYFFRYSIRIFGHFKGSFYNLVMLVPWVFWVRGSSMDLFVYYLVFGVLAGSLVFWFMSLRFVYRG